MSRIDVRFLKGFEIIRSHINSTQECGMVFKLKRFAHLSDQSFGLDSPIGFEALSLVLSLKVGE